MTCFQCRGFTNSTTMELACWVKMVIQQHDLSLCRMVDIQSVFTCCPWKGANGSFVSFHVANNPSITSKYIPAFLYACHSCLPESFNVQVRQLANSISNPRRFKLVVEQFSTLEDYNWHFGGIHFWPDEDAQMYAACFVMGKLQIVVLVEWLVSIWQHYQPQRYYILLWPTRLWKSYD